MIKKYFFILCALFFAHAGFAGEPNIGPGMWKGVLRLNDSTDLPFYFEVKNPAIGRTSFEFINGEERIPTDEIRYSHDTAFIYMPVFDSEFKVKIIGNDQMSGVWMNRARKDKNVIAFKASLLPPETAYNAMKYNSADLKGKWEADFSPASPKDTYKAVGIFKADENRKITGTFLTETGDYRYLSGQFTDFNNFYLGCFDGAHAFLFKGTVKGDSIVNGRFYSGSHFQEPWIARRNAAFELRNPDSLTYLKPGYTKIAFNFKDLEGRSVTLDDPAYKGKVVIVQLMGSWCPNCMDETKFLAPFYEQYKKKGLEVIGLAFERTNDYSKAVQNITRLKKRFSAEYTFLITMKTGKDQASEALPMLNGIMAFPTTIYIDKKGIVRKIYTGFSGPATGDAYTRYVEETTRFVEKLLLE